MIDSPATTDRRPSRTLRRLAAVAMVGTALALAACSSSGSSTATTNGSSTSGSKASSGGASSGSTITISNFSFSPSDLKVAPGAKVTVMNKDKVVHTVTGKSGGFNTGNIAAGSSKTFTAPTKAGTYPYICSIHQYMAATLTVS